MAVQASASSQIAQLQGPTSPVLDQALACPTLLIFTPDYASRLCYSQPFLPLQKLYLLAFPGL